MILMEIKIMLNIKYGISGEGTDVEDIIKFNNIQMMVTIILILNI